MDIEQGQQTPAEKTAAARSSGNGPPKQAITGVMPPQLGEALIREAWPTVVDSSAFFSGIAKKLIHSVVLAPVAWLLLAPLFGKKFLPFRAKRYTLTNRRVMIQRGLRPQPVHEVALADIDDVRLDAHGVEPFFLSGNLEIVSKGQVVLKLTGVPEPEGFRHAILNSVKAWVPGKATGPFQPASAVGKV
jgi:hypothetical protein